LVVEVGATFWYCELEHTVSDAHCRFVVDVAAAV
jgi:hypothetical protein